MIQTNDFRYMWRGKIKQVLSEKDAYRLAPVLIKKQNHDQALLLLHGFSSTPAVYRLMIPQLTKYDAISCPALPGHGQNLTAFSQAKAKDWLSDAQKAYDELKAEYTHVDVMGLSLGGLLACHLGNHNQIRHLYLLSPALSLKMNNKISRILAKLLQWLGVSQIPNRAGNLHTQEHFELTYTKLPIATIIEILTLINQGLNSLPTCPTDLFLGVFDKVVDVKKVAHLFEDSPNVRLHWLNNSAHVLPIDGDVSEIIHCVDFNFKES